MFYINYQLVILTTMSSGENDCYGTVGTNGSRFKTRTSYDCTYKYNCDAECFSDNNSLDCTSVDLSS